MIETGLNFPDIDPVAIAIGPLQIRWYALAYLAGFLLGWRYALRIAGRDKGVRPNSDDIDDFIPWVIAGVILGGRLGYILFYQFDFYMSHPLNVLKLWQGGMSFHGGIVGVIAVLLLYSRIKKIPALRLSDIASCAAPIGVFFGRLTNFINGELYGRASDVPWAVKFPAGGYVPRHPSQIYESFMEGFLLFLILFIAMRIDAVRNRPGILSGIFLIGYAAFRSISELFREPDAQIGFIFGHFSMGQLLSLPVVMFGLGVMIYALKQGRDVKSA